jgi:hypothetical protein
MLVTFQRNVRTLDKQQLELYVFGILQSCRVIGVRRQKERVQYRLHPFGALCRDAFRTLFGLSHQRLIALVAHLRDHGAVARVHGRVGMTPKHAFTDAQRDLLCNWILEFAETYGEHSPGRKRNNDGDLRDVDVLYLPACYTITLLHRMYEEERPAGAPSVHAETFRQALHSDRCKHIRIRAPRSDMCDDCCALRTALSGAQNGGEMETIGDELAAHLRLARLCRDEYVADTAEAVASRDGDDPCSHVSFDFGQNLTLPHFADQPSLLYFLSLLNVMLFCVLDEVRGVQTNYVYHEGEGAKGSNNVVSMLVDHFYRMPAQQRRRVVYHCDNCTGQNKNNAVMKLMCWLCLTGRAVWIEVKFMLKGHTKFGPDGRIGTIKKAFKRRDAFTLEHIREIVDGSSDGNRCRLFPASHFCDFRTPLDRIFRDVPGISGYHYFRFRADRPGCVEVKRLPEDEYTSVSLLLEPLKEGERHDAYAFDAAPLEEPGIAARKRNDLFRKIREHVPAEHRDWLCPDPSR